MRSCLLLTLPLLAPLAVAAANNVPQTHGVHPAHLARYKPQGTGSAQTWTCLDSSKQLPWTSVNDDYCDCPDGSDEPGTGACPQTTFYCKNEGHIGASILSSRVNDGLCEPDCCDGSDEPSGVCKDSCKEVGEEYRKRVDAERKLRKTGSKIRSTYIAFAQKEKKRLEGEIADSEKEIATREKEVARLKDIVDRTESLSAAALEHKKQSPLYASLVAHANALKSLQREHKKHLEREKSLGDILNSLRSGYNPNYQDMAVLEAVRGWEYHAGLPHIGVEEDAENKDEEGSDEVEEAPEAVEEELEEDMWTAEQLEKDLDGLLKADYVSLLMEHDTHIGASSTESILFDLAAYIPDALLPQYEAVRGTVVSWLAALSIIPPPSGGAADPRAREAYNDAEHSLSLAKKELEQAQTDLADLFDPTGFGKEGEWKKLDNTCLSTDTGDYTYEVCLFDEARQKPNKGGTTFSLGKFASWHPSSSVEVGSPEYYSKQMYKQGAKCWNGPHRSVILHLVCGTENAIHTVEELEKCEYQLTGTSPALCLPLEEGKLEKDEL